MESFGSFLKDISPLLQDSGLVPESFIERLSTDLKDLPDFACGKGIGFELRAESIPKLGTDIFLRAVNPKNFLTGFDTVSDMSSIYSEWQSVYRVIQEWNKETCDRFFKLIGSCWFEFDYAQGNKFYKPNFWFRFAGNQGIQPVIDSITQPLENLLKSEFSNIDTSKYLQWISASGFNNFWISAIGYMVARKRPTFAVFVKLHDSKEIATAIEKIGRGTWAHVDHLMLDELLSKYHGNIYLNFAFQDGELSPRLGIEFVGNSLSSDFFEVLRKYELIHPTVAEKIEQLEQRQIRGAFSEKAVVDVLTLDHIKILFDAVEPPYSKIYFGALSFDYNTWSTSSSPIMEIKN